MQRENLNVWTAHNSHGCFQGEKLIILHDGVIVAETIYKPEAAQPRAYFQVNGKVTQKGAVTYITV